MTSDDLLKKILRKELIFTKHAEVRLKQRKIAKEEIINAIKDIKNNEIIEKEKENSSIKIKIMHRLSKRKALIIVVAINTNVRVVTAYRTSKLLKKVKLWKRK